MVGNAHASNRPRADGRGMTDETENLVLKHLKAMRKELADFRSEMGEFRSEVGQRFAIVSQRLDHMEKRTEASQYILTATLGSMLADSEDVKARLAALENA
jgi:hypothetical protein